MERKQFDVAHLSKLAFAKLLEKLEVLRLRSEAKTGCIETKRTGGRFLGFDTPLHYVTRLLNRRPLLRT